VDYWSHASFHAKSIREQTESLSGFARDVASMTRTVPKLSCALLLMLAIGGESALAQKTAGPQGPEEGVIRRQSWLIPAQDRTTLMWTMVARPPGDGPFPLAIVSHGTLGNEMRRAQFQRPQFLAVARLLVERGYVVAVPQRPGHGETGGPYYEAQGRCADADFRRSGRSTAAAITAAIDYMVGQSFVRKGGLIAVGQSAGGWGSLALAAEQPPAGLKAVVAFAPGRGGRVNDEPNRNCAPERLVAAAREFGQKTRIPTLWLYSRNDSFFGPELSQKLVDAYRAGGGKAEYHLLPALEGDGHNLISARDGVPQWMPLMEEFLRKVR
jgi:dienelactone hydrolase